MRSCMQLTATDSVPHSAAATVHAQTAPRQIWKNPDRRTVAIRAQLDDYLPAAPPVQRQHAAQLPPALRAAAAPARWPWRLHPATAAPLPPPAAPPHCRGTTHELQASESLIGVSDASQVGSWRPRWAAPAAASCKLCTAVQLRQLAAGMRCLSLRLQGARCVMQATSAQRQPGRGKG